jgi:hypothetical protein
MPALANATQFKGSVDYWGQITINVTGSTVTAINGQSGGVTCASGTSVGGIQMMLAAPVAIANGRFHAEGVGKTVGWGTPTTWSLDGSISIRRVISGTVTATAQVPGGEICKGTFAMDAVVAPSRSHSPATSMYEPHMPPSAGTVRFDYRHGALTHLVIVAPMECPNGAAYTADFDSTSYRVDAIQVNRGHFRLATDVLDAYGVVVHISLTGTINGRHAAGAISANRGQDINGKKQNCSGHGSWNSDMPSTAPAPDAASSGAFYGATPYRFGRAGAWTYYLLVQPKSCAGGVTAVRFTVGGASTTVKCGARAKLGPLSSKRTYRITATAIRSHGSPITLADSSIYIPGDDGDWVRVP